MEVVTILCLSSSKDVGKIEGESAVLFLALLATAHRQVTET